MGGGGGDEAGGGGGEAEAAVDVEAAVVDNVNPTMDASDATRTASRMNVRDDLAR